MSRTSNRSIADTRWLVTGASGGLGAALVDSLTAHGARVVGLSRLSGPAPRAGVVQVDWHDDNDIQRGIDEAVEILGGTVDVLVNNAGYGLVGAALDTSAAKLADLMHINFHVPALLSCRVAELMLPHSYGWIFQIGSLSASDPAPGMSAYAASKAALAAYSTSMTRELSSLGVRVVTVEPGGMRTSWAGANLQRVPVSTRFEPTAGETARLLDRVDGSQPLTSSEAADWLVHLPRRLEGRSWSTIPLGADALGRIRSAATSRLRTLDEQEQSGLLITQEPAVP